MERMMEMMAMFKGIVKYVFYVLNVCSHVILNMEAYIYTLYASIYIYIYRFFFSIYIYSMYMHRFVSVVFRKRGGIHIYAVYMGWAQ